MISDTKQAINEIMGVKNSSNEFRPITKAIEITEAEERAKDKRQNQGGFSKMQTSGDSMARVSEKYKITRSIYGIYNRADQILSGEIENLEKKPVPKYIPKPDPLPKIDEKKVTEVLF